MAGAPLDLITRALPAPVMDAVGHATETAMRGALHVALATLPKAAETGAEPGALAPLGPEISPSGAHARWSSSSGSRPGDRGHKALAAVSGAIGGAFGLSTLTRSSCRSPPP